MKYLFLVFAFVCMVLGVKAQNLVYSKGCTPSTNYVDSIYYETWPDTTPWVLKTKKTICNVTGNRYDISFWKYNGWENEPGDYTVIRISHNGTNILEQKYDDGWNYFYTENDYVRDTTGLRIVKDSKRPVKVISLANDAIALVLTGVTIMSQPPLLTVIVISNRTAKIVFSKEACINDVKEFNGVTAFHLQMNTIEHQDNEPSEEPILKTLTFKNGAIYYQ